MHALVVKNPSLVILETYDLITWSIAYVVRKQFNKYLEGKVLHEINNRQEAIQLLYYMKTALQCEKDD